MPDPIEVTLIIRPPAAAKNISERLLSGHYDAAETNPSDLSADPSDVKAVTDFVAAHGLEVVKLDAAARSMHVTGSAGDIEKAFGIVSGKAGHGSVEARNYQGAVDLPAPLKAIVIAVLGLDHTAIARHHGGSN